MDNFGDIDIKIELVEQSLIDEMSENMESDVKVNSSILTTTSKASNQSTETCLPRLKRKKMEVNGKVSKIKCSVVDLLESNIKKSKKLDETEKMLKDELEGSLLQEVQIDDTNDNCELDENDHLNYDGTESAWLNFVVAKKRKYCRLLEKKNVVMSVIEKAQEIKNKREQILIHACEEIEAKKEVFATFKEDITRLELAFKEEVDKNDAMKDYVKQEYKKVEKSSKTIQDISSLINNIEDDIVSVLEVHENKSYVLEANADVTELKTANLNLNQLIADCISAKEKHLTCPVCHHLANPPIYKCPAEHLICRTCYGQVKTRCPVCSCQMDRSGMFSRFTTAEVIWEEWKEMKTKLSDT